MTSDIKHRWLGPLLFASLVVLLAAGCAPVQDPQVEKAREKSEQAGREAKREATKDAKDVKEGAQQLGQQIGEGARKLDEQTRPARQQLGVEARKAGEKLKEGTKKLGSEAVAVAQGVHKGWMEGDNPVNINSASKSELLSIAELNEASVRRIIAARPYQRKNDLVRRKVISADTYVKVEDKITTE